MEYLMVLATALGSLFVLFIMTKIMGNKQMSELTMFDYIIGISIGSIAAEMATELENFDRCILAIVIYGLVSFCLSFLSSKSIIIRRFIFGKSLVLYYSGTIYRKNFKKAHIDLSEFLMQCRIAGYYDLSKIKMVTFEASGKLSFLPCDSDRPVTPTDMKIPVSPEAVQINFIMDGKLLNKNVSAAGKTEKWVKNELNAQGIKTYSDVFLATFSQNKLRVFKNNEKPASNDIFQ